MILFYQPPNPQTWPFVPGARRDGAPARHAGTAR
jgi:hypothetical protein